ncbi:hypothetical protein [Streptomyces sp. NRRL S-244]|uniref:hypothetical protein n=1 Tax=Streptomyces sp. NRRL S-244 TaxID=1463897 RepID=UPI000A6C08B4|nr:hypothetical protein [Streptomyces sp. NRRL S-244]
MSLLATILVVVGLWCAASVAVASCFSAYRIWCRSEKRRRGASGRLGAETGRS